MYHRVVSCRVHPIVIASEAIQFFATEESLDCFASLAMTAVM
jgi:hypothetical protein